MPRNRPTVRRQLALEQALRLMIEAAEIQGQPFGDSLVSPESPGGQLTAIRPDGRPVDRWKFQSQATLIARQILNGADASLLLEKIK